jgi:hypothetical protein
MAETEPPFGPKSEELQKNENSRLFKKLKENSTIEIHGQKIAIPAATLDKTFKIFTERVLVFFPQDTLSEEVANALFRIQLIIFLIDNYYESHWDYKEDEISPLWDEVTLLIRHLGVGENQVKQFLQDIRAYEKVEQQMRKGDTPDSVEIKNFYFLKSCDVRLQRHLAKFVQAGEVCSSTPVQTDYDILGEILDDIDDMEEDQARDVYNGNRLIFDLKKNRQAAIDEYKNFISSIANKYEANDSSGIRELAGSVLEKIQKILLAEEAV